MKEYSYKHKSQEMWLRPQNAKLEISESKWYPKALLNSINIERNVAQSSDFSLELSSLNLTSSPNKNFSYYGSAEGAAPLNRYWYNILLNFAAALEIPLEMQQKIQKTKELLAEIGGINKVPDHYFADSLFGGSGFSFTSLTPSIEPRYYEVLEGGKNYEDKQKAEMIVQKLNGIKQFISLNQEVLDYIHTNIERIEKVLGEVEVFAKVKIRAIKALSPPAKLKIKTPDQAYSTLVDNLFLKVPYKSYNEPAYYEGFDKAENYQIFKKNRPQIEADLKSSLSTIFKEQHKKLDIDFDIVLDEEIGLYAKTHNLLKNNSLNNYALKERLNHQGFEAPRLYVFAHMRFALRKFIPTSPHVSKQLAHMLEVLPNYQYIERTHEEKYTGDKSVYFIFAAPKPGTHAEKSNHPAGFFVNRRGVQLTLKIEEAQSFPSEAVAKAVFEKSYRSDDYVASYVKTQLKIEAFSGTQPTSNKEFMNFLAQWETDVIKKMFASSPGASTEIENSRAQGAQEPVKRPHKI